MQKRSIAILFSALMAGCSSQIQLPSDTSFPDTEVPVTVGELGKVLYLRGDFSLWDAEQHYELKPKLPGIYSAKVRFMSPGKVYEFKIADAAWTEGYNCGYLEEGRLELGKPQAADCKTVYNYFSFRPNRKGWYEVQLDYRNPNTPNVLIVKA